MEMEAFSRKDEVNGAIYHLYRIVKYSTAEKFFYMFILPKFALFKLNINRGIPGYLCLL